MADAAVLRSPHRTMKSEIAISKKGSLIDSINARLPTFYHRQDRAELSTGFLGEDTYAALCPLSLLFLLIRLPVHTGMSSLISQIQGAERGWGNRAYRYFTSPGLRSAQLDVVIFIDRSDMR